MSHPAVGASVCEPICNMRVLDGGRGVRNKGPGSELGMEMIVRRD